jgi:hypothetical protein
MACAHSITSIDIADVNRAPVRPVTVLKEKLSKYTATKKDVSAPFPRAFIAKTAPTFLPRKQPFLCDESGEENTMACMAWTAVLL